VTDQTALSPRADLERQVREYFPRHVAACEELLSFAVDLVEVDPWRGRSLDPRSLADSLVASESARGLKTYRASLDTALGGFGPQCAMLNRALFEGMATACWTTMNRELAAERFRNHLRHNRALWSKRFLDRHLIEQPFTGIPEGEEMRKLDKLFGRWGEKLWCGLAMHELVKSIQDQWEDPVELRTFFAIAHAANNETQHTTARSLTTPVIADSETDFRVESGPSLRFVEQGLYAALWTYGHLLRVTADYFEIDGREQIGPLFKRCRAACEPIDPVAARVTSRNDPCPCGSGQKFKRCHGA
jgi:hypothetical protein